MLVGPGDDAAVLRIRNGHVVVSTDLLVEGRHFRRDWASAADIGHRAAAANLSDINAMGGTRPLADDRARRAARPAGAVGAGLRRRASPRSAPWSAPASSAATSPRRDAGRDRGDGDRGRALQAPVLRSGAQPGDVLALAGRQGWAAGGLAVLGRGFRSPRVLVEAYRRPEPPYAAGPAAAAAGRDRDDRRLRRAARRRAATWPRPRGVAIDLRRDAFEIAEPLHAVGAAARRRPAAVRARRRRRPLAARDLPRRRRCPTAGRSIGTVAEGEGVTVDGAAYDGPTGWTHF